MKKILFIGLVLLIPVLIAAQGHKGSVGGCAPMKDGKVCYSDNIEMGKVGKSALFSAINRWAQKNYGKDYALSNVSTNKSAGTIHISSKVELLLNKTEKTVLKYKMNITCEEHGYTVELTDIRYQYDPKNDKKYKTYKAEDVIANDGKSNTVEIIKDPKLFCDATYFFAENLFGDVFDAAQTAR